jgi:RNA polymerase sigma factor (sigma-70 family)
MNNIEIQLFENVKEFVGSARKRFGVSELAADAVHNSLLKALKSGDQLHDEENAKAWFYRILRRTIVDLYRRRDARDRALERLEHELNAAPDACGVCLHALATPKHDTAVRQLDPAD